jgi:DNA helicase-2/ATP-dependent DNA helicase PcrA
MGELPYHFRGDRDSLPVFSWRTATTRKELVDAQKAFVEDVKKHRGAEERRLMYVAITRARHRVLLSGSFWAHHTTARPPSVFLKDLEEAGIVDALPTHPQNENPPEAEASEERVWPPDPLGSRRAVVEQAAASVREVQAGELGDPLTPAASGLITRLDRARSSSSGIEVRIPLRIPASSLERWFLDPDAQRAALRRPLPQKPYRQALRGTLFHSYVEEHFEQKPLHPLSGLESDDDADTLGMEEWIQAFESSPFATLTPLAIEQELHLPVAGHLVVCKLDAVFPGDAGPHIVDWKTGAKPSDPREIEAKALQLAAYRAAWSQWTGVSQESVTASFWYAGDSTLLTLEVLPTLVELEDIFRPLWSD